MPSRISFIRSPKTVRPLEMMVSFRFGALCHVFRVLSNLLETLQRFTFLTHPISCSKIWRSSTVPKNGQISILNMLPNLWFLKQVPYYISLGSLLTNFRVAWSNSFLNRRAQQEKSQRPLCSTCTDDGTIASWETKNCWVSSGAQIWYIQTRNIDLLPKDIFFWNLFDKWRVEILNLNARYSANCHVGYIGQHQRPELTTWTPGGSPSKNLRINSQLGPSLFTRQHPQCQETDGIPLLSQMKNLP